MQREKQLFNIFFKQRQTQRCSYRHDCMTNESFRFAFLLWIFLQLKGTKLAVRFAKEESLLIAVTSQRKRRLCLWKRLSSFPRLNENLWGEGFLKGRNLYMCAVGNVVAGKFYAKLYNRLKESEEQLENRIVLDWTSYCTIERQIQGLTSLSTNLRV